MSRGAAVVYVAAGSLILYSGIKGATISDTIKAVLSGKLTVTDTEPISPSSGSGGSNPTAAPTGGSGPVSSGSTLANGTTIYKFFRANGYDPMQAAGAIASIWGESTWNPEAVGTGGCGLIGWTPPSTLATDGGTCRKAGIGNNSDDQDFQSQLGAILTFVSKNGDQGAVDMMKGAQSVNDAAQIWGQKVERYGINDVHAEGIATAVKIAETVDNVSLKPS